MKAIVPVAGAGVRLRPHTYTQPKPLILVAGKPIISFIIDQLIEAGVEEFVFVLGYLGEKIKDYLDKAYPDLNKAYVYQSVRRGLGDAILHTRDEVIDEQELIVLLGDTIVDLDIKKFISQQGSSIAIQKVNDPRQFGVVEEGPNNKIIRVVEKPSIPKSNLAIVGLYKFTNVPALFKALEGVKAETEEDGSEVHLTNGMMKMIDNGVNFTSYEVDNWYDCGKKEILLETNKVLLARNVNDVGTQFIYDHSIIIPPVVFGKSCSFENAIIGPNVTLGDNVKISNSLLKNSILGDYVEIKGAVLTDSVIGNDAIIKGLSQSLNIGDNNEIDFTK